MHMPGLHHNVQIDNPHLHSPGFGAASRHCQMKGFAGRSLRTALLRWLPSDLTLVQLVLETSSCLLEEKRIGCYFVISPMICQYNSGTCLPEIVVNASSSITEAFVHAIPKIDLQVAAAAIRGLPLGYL